MGRLTRIADRLESVLALAERALAPLAPTAVGARDFEAHRAFRWAGPPGHGRLVPISHPLDFDLADLVGVDRSVERLLRNTEQFLIGAPSNHVLLHGERGTGKSSAVRGLLTRYADRGLRLVEVHKSRLLELPEVIDLVRDLPFHVLLFADDLAFDEGESHYRELKAALEGSLAAPPANVRILATSNRRHLIPERRSDQRGAHLDEDGELRLGEALEEKLALADRFGLVLAFYGFDQPTYLEIVGRYARKAGLTMGSSELREEALRWALDRSSRSGRTARQFVDDLAGRQALERRASGGGAGS